MGLPAIEHANASGSSALSTEARPANDDRSAEENLAAAQGMISTLIDFSLVTTHRQHDLIGDLLARSESLANSVDLAMTKVAESGKVAVTLGDELGEETERAGKDLADGLARTVTELHTRLQHIDAVLSEIGNIGRRLNLLALNATIEAARSGEAGRGFAIVAHEVKELAQHAMTNAKQASERTDIAGVQASISIIAEQTKARMTKLSASTVNSVDQLKGLFEGVGEAFSKVAKDGSGIAETTMISKALVERTESRSVQASDLARELQKLRSLGSASTNRAVEQILTRSGFSADIRTDRLAAIRARGTLRVAIEPKALGVSFRSTNGGALQGLDVDYATAFAKWLGVRCEFVEAPWEVCMELPVAGRRTGEPPADLMWSQLPPDSAHQHLAFSRPYTALNYVLIRRAGQDSIRGIHDLNAKVLGYIADPAAAAMLESLGLRGPANRDKPGGRTMLSNLIGISDQKTMHGLLAEGTFDAFVSDQPLFHWACTSRESPWHGRIEIIPGNIAPRPWVYAVAVAAQANSLGLLREIDRFIDAFVSTPERRAIEERWQGGVVDFGASKDASSAPGIINAKTLAAALVARGEAVQD